MILFALSNERGKVCAALTDVMLTGDAAQELWVRSIPVDQWAHERADPVHVLVWDLWHAHLSAHPDKGVAVCVLEAESLGWAAILPEREEWAPDRLDWIRRRVQFKTASIVMGRDSDGVIHFSVNKQ